MHRSRNDWESSTAETSPKDTDELILGGGGNEGQVKHIKTGHTGNTHGLEVKSLRPEQR